MVLNIFSKLGNYEDEFYLSEFLLLAFEKVNLWKSKIFVKVNSDNLNNMKSVSVVEAFSKIVFTENLMSIEKMYYSEFQKPLSQQFFLKDFLFSFRFASAL